METIALIILSLISLLTLTALFLILHMLFPSRLERIRARAQKHPRRTFWLGLVNTAFAAALALGLFALGDRFGVFFIPAFAVTALYAAGLFFGLGALAEMVGSRLLPAKQERLQVIWGSVLLILASLAPIVGWFLLFPYLGIRAFGSALLSFTGSSRPPIKERID